MTTINQIAKSLKMNSKTARRILRNSKNVPRTVSKDRWTFKPADVRKVKALLAA